MLRAGRVVASFDDGCSISRDRASRPGPAPGTRSCADGSWPPSRGSPAAGRGSSTSRSPPTRRSGSRAGTWQERRSARGSTSSSSSSRSPADRTRKRVTRPSDPLRTAGSLAGPGGGLSVLLVDDEDLVRRLLARYLVEGGYRVVEAGDVESAVERGASLGEAGVRFVLVADLNMPASAGDSFRGGVEVVKRLAKLRLRPPVVMMADGAISSLGAKPMRGVWSLVLEARPLEARPRGVRGGHAGARRPHGGGRPAPRVRRRARLRPPRRRRHRSRAHFSRISTIMSHGHRPHRDPAGPAPGTRGTAAC